jgi:hypothetical protein
MRRYYPRFFFGTGSTNPSTYPVIRPSLDYPDS